MQQDSNALFLLHRHQEHVIHALHSIDGKHLVTIHKFDSCFDRNDILVRVNTRRRLFYGTFVLQNDRNDLPVKNHFFNHNKLSSQHQTSPLPNPDFPSELYEEILL